MTKENCVIKKSDDGMQLNDQQAGPNDFPENVSKSDLDSDSSKSNDQKVVHPKISIQPTDEEEKVEGVPSKMVINNESISQSLSGQEDSNLSH